VSLVGLSYAPADTAIAVTILTAVVGLNAGHYTGYMVRSSKQTNLSTTIDYYRSKKDLSSPPQKFTFNCHSARDLKLFFLYRRQGF
jgi:hypothetical protein